MISETNSWTKRKRKLCAYFCLRQNALKLHIVSYLDYFKEVLCIGDARKSAL